MSTGIEWTDETWNPVTGCDQVSPGCDKCYALTMAKRLKAMGNPRYQNDGRAETSGPGFGLTLHHDKLEEPLRWRKPRRVFVNSMSDLFHPEVEPSFVAAVFDVMRRTTQHTYQVLTKRPKRMRMLLRDGRLIGDDVLPNVWLGVSVEDQKRADQRIPALLDTPAAVRFLSCEPLLDTVNLWRWVDPCDPNVDCDVCGRERFEDEIGVGHAYYIYNDEGSEEVGEEGWCDGPTEDARPRKLHWVIVGGESGSGARPMHPGWARTLRDQCTAAGVPFFFKQWGAWAPASAVDGGTAAGSAMHSWPRGSPSVRVGKKAAGRELDGRTWDEFPQAVPA